MKQNLIAFARSVDAFCGRMNSGLAAVATVLALIAAARAVELVQPYVPQISDTVMTGFQASQEN